MGPMKQLSNMFAKTRVRWWLKHFLTKSKGCGHHCDAGSPRPHSLFGILVEERSPGPHVCHSCSWLSPICADLREGVVVLLIVASFQVCDYTVLGNDLVRHLLHPICQVGRYIKKKNYWSALYSCLCNQTEFKQLHVQGCSPQVLQWADLLKWNNETTNSG